MSKRTFEQLTQDEFDEVNQIVFEYESQTELFSPPEAIAPPSPNIFIEDAVKKEIQYQEEKTTKRLEWELKHVHEYIISLLTYADVKDKEDLVFRYKLIKPHLTKAFKTTDYILYRLCCVTDILL